jgi:hypothetical protein
MPPKLDTFIRWQIQVEDEIYGQSLNVPYFHLDYPHSLPWMLKELAQSMEKTIQEKNITKIDSFIIETEQHLTYAPEGL